MELESGWQIGIWTPIRCPRCGGGPGDSSCGKVIHASMEAGVTIGDATEEEEREAIKAAGCEPEERIDSGIWIAAIPADWARQAEMDETSEPGLLIQECNQHTAAVDGREWIIEVPIP